ncbi:hypothetical protein [Janthinobacterium sp. HH01]|uniref:hypothetical protein n=1 Tax=Janthinobacterium sp. HH01 TaxID=1198452 RepID=UPI00178C1715|nr:hypothetical protein [Janthinobacterium sp. HH01]
MNLIAMQRSNDISGGFAFQIRMRDTLMEWLIDFWIFLRWTCCAAWSQSAGA